MSRRKPIPFSPIPFTNDDDDVIESEVGHQLWKSAPLNEWDALMRAGPHEVVERSQDEWLPIREAICDAMDEVLTETERLIVNATVIERKALRAIGEELGISKSTVHNIARESLTKLRAHLTRGSDDRNADDELNNRRAKREEDRTVRSDTRRAA